VYSVFLCNTNRGKKVPGKKVRGIKSTVYI